MPIGKPKPKKVKICPVGLAIFALEPTLDPLEMPIDSFDTPPIFLVDLHDQASGCPRHHYACTECGVPLREGCHHS